MYPLFGSGGGMSSDDSGDWEEDQWFSLEFWFGSEVIFIPSEAAAM